MQIRLPLSAVFLAAATALAMATVLPASAIVTPDQQTSMLAAHNKLRRDVATAETARLGKSVSIPDLTWDAAAATMAQAWANQLITRSTLDHNAGRGAYGENLATFENTAPFPDPNPSGPDTAFAGWKSEQASYNWDTNTCTSECGHYKQAVWASAQAVGCGMATGPGVLIPGGYRTVWVCYYTTAATDARPYEAGSAVSPSPTASSTSTPTATGTAAAGDGGFSGNAPGRGSVGLLVTNRVSSPAGLTAALTSAGCSAATIGVLEGGVWKIYVVGAPAIVNAAFPTSLPSSTPFFVRCQS